MLKRKEILSVLSLAAWSLSIFGYFFQFPFAFFSKLITPCLIIYLLLQIKEIKLLKNKPYLILLTAFFFFLLFSVIRSFALGTEFSRILRFALILFCIPLSCTITDGAFTFNKEVFLRLAVIKSSMLLFFGALIMIVGDFETVRDWLHLNGFSGDIYFLNRLIPKVQVQGNALLVVAFILDCLNDRRITARKIILLLGILVAGNFAFILALIAFIAWQGGKVALHLMKTNKFARILIPIALIILANIFGIYILSKIEEKAALSNAVRLIQARVLLDANPYIGDGLGTVVKYTSELVSYDGDTYFEMQTLYIFKQIGAIGLGLFYAVTLKPIWALGKAQFIFYLIYLFFSFWNPYCFDATQIITILLITNALKGEKNDKSSYYSLPPCSFGKRKYTKNI